MSTKQIFSHPQPATAIVSHRVDAAKTTDYRAAQGEITQAVRAFPGFIATEVIEPVPGLQDEWVIIFRFESNDALKSWLESPIRSALVSKTEFLLAEPSRIQILAGADRSKPPVTMVFSHHVRPERAEEYKAWRRKANAVQARFPGYLGIESFEPRDNLQEEWVDILRFESAEHLENWMASGERQKLRKELETIVESIRANRIATGLEGWFAFQQATASVTPAWKQALAVLLALYPTVVILNLALRPPLKGLQFPLLMLITNILSVSLLTWLIMPRLSRWLSFWLGCGPGTRFRWIREIAGVALVVAMIAAFAALFLWLAR